jgi:hypothetical protein
MSVSPKWNYLIINLQLRRVWAKNWSQSTSLLKEFVSKGAAKYLPFEGNQPYKKSQKYWGIPAAWGLTYFTMPNQILVQTPLRAGNLLWGCCIVSKGFDRNQPYTPVMHLWFGRKRARWPPRRPSLDICLWGLVPLKPHEIKEKTTNFSFCWDPKDIIAQ